MRHTPLDHHARRSPFFAVEPRTKIIGTVAFIVCVAVMTTLEPLLVALVFVLLLATVSRVPAGHYLKRYAIALPFIVFPALSALLTAGPEQFAVFVVRISTCVLALLVLSSTTPFFELVKSLRRLGLPEVFTIMLTFLYRYAFLFEEELERMLRSRRSRGFRGGKSLLDRRAMDSIGAMTGMVLVRAYTRGVRVYDALTGRGYRGEVRTLDSWRLDAGSVGLCLCMALFGIFLVTVDRGWLPGLA